LCDNRIERLEKAFESSIAHQEALLRALSVASGFEPPQPNRNAAAKRKR